MTNLIIKDIDGISYMHLNLVNYYSNTSQVEFLVNLSKNGFFANKTVYGKGGFDIIAKGPFKTHIR